MFGLYLGTIQTYGQTAGLPGLRGLVHVEYSVRDRFPKVATWEDPSPKIRKPASLLGNNVGIDPRYLTGVTTILNLSLSVSRSEP